jgi:hypothetical protein
VIKAYINALEVKAKLLAMSDKARKRTYQRVLRRAASPVVKDLQRAWAKAKRRSGLVTGEIADAQQVKIRVWKKGARNGAVTMQIGTNYKRGGYANIWHILENGFRHYGKSNAYASFGEISALKRKKTNFLKNAVKGMEGDERRHAWNRAQGEYMRRYPQDIRAEYELEREKASNVERARKSGGKMIRGWKVSRPIAQRHVSTVAQRAQELLVAEIMKPAKKKGGKK